MHRLLQQIPSSLTVDHYHERFLFTLCAILVAAVVVDLSQRLDRTRKLLRFSNLKSSKCISCGA